jgi:hypothetical protein
MVSTPHIIPVKELAIIRDRLHAASAKPWRVESDPERIGENWFLFSCGLSADNKQYYVTTDNVPASQEYGDPATDAEFIVWCRNDMGRIGNAYLALREMYDDLMTALRTLDDADAWAGKHDDWVVAQARAALEAIYERAKGEAS